MTGIIKIHHVAMVVKNIDQSLAFWKDALGIPLEGLKDVPKEAAKIAFLSVGEGKIELVQPVGKESGLTRYLEKKGEGMHHICIQVDDILAMMEKLKNKGIRLINESPVLGDGGRKYAFIHPESTGGVLVELYEMS